MAQPDPASQAWPPPPPPQALQCPRCGAPAQPSPSPQTCRCGLRFVLQAGAFLDRSVQPPPPDPQARRLTVRTSGLLGRYGGLDADAVVEGALDPIIGRLAMTSTKIAYRGIYTVAFWRSIAWREAVAVLLVPVPLTLLVASSYLTHPESALLLLLLPLAALTAWALASVFLYRACYVRVVGAVQTLTFRFDRPFLKRRRFHDELLRRGGLAASPMP